MFVLISINLPWEKGHRIQPYDQVNLICGSLSEIPVSDVTNLIHFLISWDKMVVEPGWNIGKLPLDGKCLARKVALECFQTKHCTVRIQNLQLSDFRLKSSGPVGPVHSDCHPCAMVEEPLHLPADHAVAPAIVVDRPDSQG